jgi:ATP/maltotriose-dependent transcriptional regulator MalT
LKASGSRFTLKVVGVVESPGAPVTQSDATSWFAPWFLLEESKLQPPSLQAGTARRVGAVDRLRAADLPVVSIVGPPGYGKSALLRQWVEEAPRQVAWVSIQDEDNDPAVLLAYIAAALDRVQPIDVDVLRTRAPPGMSVAARVARRVAATMSGMAEPVALVLDHTELLHNPREPRVGHPTEPHVVGPCPGCPSADPTRVVR